MAVAWTFAVPLAPLCVVIPAKAGIALALALAPLHAVIPAKAGIALALALALAPLHAVIPAKAGMTAVEQEQSKGKANPKRSPNNTNAI